MSTGIPAAMTTFATPIGSCGIAWRDDRICAVQLPEQTDEITAERLNRVIPGAERAVPPAAVEAVIARICEMLAGSGDDLQDVDIDLRTAPEFAQQVYTVTRSVSPGQTTTYGEIAARLGAPRASREVGQALGRNPVPLIVPCHRVLAADGKLGGFSAPGGVTTKLRLLGIEGATPNGQPALF